MSFLKYFAVGVGVLCAGMLWVPSIQGQVSSFSRDLRLGSQGMDVMHLQQLLNQNPLTQVAFSGPGSPGQETSYFGPLTKSAVAEFQEQHKTSILTPLGLVRGTGFVGPATRLVLNGQAPQTASPTPPVQVPPPNLSLPQDAPGSRTPIQPRIFSVTPSSGPAGTQVTLRGEGFTSDGNDVYASFALLRDVESDGGTISFVVRDPFPESLNIPAFVYDQVDDFQYGFYLTNPNGTSNTVLFTLEF